MNNNNKHHDRTQRYSYDPSYGQRDSYEDLFKQFERLQVKAENLAQRDPVFASRLENLAKQFAMGRKSKFQKSFTNLNANNSNENGNFSHSAHFYPPPTAPMSHPQQQQAHPPPPNYSPYHPPHYYRGHVPTPPPPPRATRWMPGFPAAACCPATTARPRPAAG